MAITRTWKTYEAEYEDNEIEVFDSENDTEAFSEACEYEKEHGIIFNLYELDENYDKVRTVY